MHRATPGGFQALRSRTVSTWDDLKPILTHLRSTGVLRGYPHPRSDRGRQPPFHITLSLSGLEVAADLCARFGDDVELTVGAMRYPDPRPLTVSTGDTSPYLGAEEARAVLIGPSEVHSGETLHTNVMLENTGSGELAIHTNGTLTALVLDADTGNIVGGFSGPQRLPLVVFRASPGESTTVPLLVGTESYVPGLGYAIPARSWKMTARMTLADWRVVRMPQLDLVVT